MSKERKNGKIKANDQFNGMYGTVAPGKEIEGIVISSDQITAIKKQRGWVAKRKLKNNRDFNELQELYTSES
jgi:hypothetical protein